MYFRKVLDGLDVGPLAAQLASPPTPWLTSKLAASPFIPLRAPVCDENFISKGPLQNFDRSEYAHYPLVPPIVAALFLAAKARMVGRIVLTKLPAGATIGLHHDRPETVAFFRRFTVMICCPPGALFTCGPEVVQMRDGEAYWFDNRQAHSVSNLTDGDRLALIIDLRTHLFP